MALETYRKKRNFKKTPEPKGTITSKSTKLFVVQKHDAYAKALPYDITEKKPNSVLSGCSITDLAKYHGRDL